MVTVHGGLTKLKQMLNSLPPSERKIAQFMIDNPERSTMYTAAKLAQASGTSSAAVIRLCKSLGFKSFQELKISVAVDMKQEVASGYRDVTPNESFKDIINKVTNNTIQTLSETVHVIDVEDLHRAVDVLKDAKSISFIGFGASYIAAMDAEQKFLRINKNAQSFSDVHMAAMTIANKGPGDVIVGISFSGKTKEVAQLLTLGNEKGCKTISITKLGKSIVSRQANISLHTSSAKEAPYRSGATSSRIALLHMIDILLMCLVSEEYEQTVQHIDDTREAIATFFPN